MSESEYQRHDSPSRPWVRHLLYHVCPFPGGIWRLCVRNLRRRLHQFNGRRIVAVATGPTCEPASWVRDAFGGEVEIVCVRNSYRFREVASFHELLRRVETRDPNHISFFAHAKGVSRPRNAGVTCHHWSELMLEICLDYPRLVEDCLERHPLAGPFKKIGWGFEGSASCWHYSGTIYWFRNEAVFDPARNWKLIDKQWWGTESWPGIHFGPGEAGCLFCEGFAQDLNLYEVACLHGRVAPQLAEWRRANRQHRVRPRPAA